MSASQDAALMVENNLPSSDPSSYDDFSDDASDSEDPSGPNGRASGGRTRQDRHHMPHGRGAMTRPSERPPVRAPGKPKLYSPDLAPPRIAPTRLTPATRRRDASLFSR
jgi:hypothetical protein